MNGCLLVLYILFLALLIASLTAINGLAPPPHVYDANDYVRDAARCKALRFVPEPDLVHSVRRTTDLVVGIKCMTNGAQIELPAQEATK